MLSDALRLITATFSFILYPLAQKCLAHSSLSLRHGLAKN